MAYDVELADRLSLLLSGQGVTSKPMFGGLAFLLNGHLAVAASGQGGLLVRVDPARTGELLTEPGAEPFEMRGRPMSGWLRVDASALDDDAVLQRWADRGLAHVRTLPPKRRQDAGRPGPPTSGGPGRAAIRRAR